LQAFKSAVFLSQITAWVASSSHHQEWAGFGHGN
jgi:hypothetical protein